MILLPWTLLVLATVAGETTTRASSQDPWRLTAESSAWSPSLRGAGRRSLETLNGSRYRLRYELAHSEELQEGELGELGFVEQWLLRELAGRFPALEPVEVVDERIVRVRHGESVSVVKRTLELTGSLAAVQEAEAFLDRLARANETELSIRAYVALRPGGEEGRPTDLTTMDAEPLRARIDEMRAGSADLLACPTLQVQGTQQARVSTVAQVAYIRDYFLERVGETLVADPVVGVVEDGCEVVVTPIVDPDGGLVHLKIALAMNVLRRPLADFETTISGSTVPVTIQLPEVDTLRVESEAITLSPELGGFVLEGPVVTVWLQNGETALRAVELVVAVDKAAAPAPGQPIADVLGFDATERIVFARRRGAEAIAESFRVLRDGKTVGRAHVVEERAGFLVLALEEGEARAGDVLE